MVVIDVFFQWDKNKFYSKSIKFEVVQSSIEEQCKLCWFYKHSLHCPESVPCGAPSREDKQYIYFKEIV